MTGTELEKMIVQTKLNVTIARNGTVMFKLEHEILFKDVIFFAFILVENADVLFDYTPLSLFIAFIGSL